MTILAAQGRNDARTAAHLLASTAKNCLVDPASAPAHVDVLNNVYRLLEAYRVNTFFGLEPVASYQSAAEAPSLIPHPEQYVKAVRDVMERSVEVAFAGQSKDEAITEITGVLKKVAYPEFGEPSEGEKTKATRFFSEMVRELEHF